MTLSEGRIADLWTTDHDAPIATTVVAADLDGDGAVEIVCGLEDGTLVAVGR